MKNNKGFAMLAVIIIVLLLLIAIVSVVSLTLLQNPTGEKVNAAARTFSNMLESSAPKPYQSTTPSSVESGIEADLNNTKIESPDADFIQMESSASAL